MNNTKRVAVYVDGFNLYHAIDALKDNKLKWLNLYALGKQLLRDNETLVKCHYFTSLVNWDLDKQTRHQTYILALQSKGVIVSLGKFKKANKRCPTSQNNCKFREEKQTDVAIGINIIADAFTNLFDRMILITADTDQIPTIEMIQTLCPEKEITWAAPPGRMIQAREIGNLVQDRFELSKGQIGTSRLPNKIEMNDHTIINIPSEYL